MGDYFKTTYWESSSVLGAEVDLWALFFLGIPGHSPRTPTTWGSFSTNPLPRTGTLRIQAPQEHLVASDRPGPHPAKPGCQRRHHLHNILCSHCAEVTECAGKHVQHTHIGNTTLSGHSLSCGISPGPRQKSSNAHHQVQLNLLPAQHHQDSASPPTTPP